MFSLDTGKAAFMAIGSQFFLSLTIANLASKGTAVNPFVAGTRPSSSLISLNIQAIVVASLHSSCGNDSTAFVSTDDTPPPGKAQ